MSKVRLDGYKGKLYYAHAVIELEGLKCPACGNTLKAEEYRMEPGAMWLDPFLNDGDLIEVLREPKKVMTFKCPECFTRVEITFDEIMKNEI